MPKATVNRLIMSIMLYSLLSTTLAQGKGVGDRRDGGILIDDNGKRYITAVRTDLSISIDGTLDEDAWGDVQFQGCFVQREPDEGAPASEDTEVGILYDDMHLYIGMKCYDSEPSKIIAREMRRDERVDDDDHVAFIIDTYHDHRSGFYFVTNPNGAQRDAVIANEGRNYNAAWDGIWSCKARIVDDGWQTEIAIPWKSLRFSPQDTVVWGINFSRMIRRKNEEAFWQLIPRDLGFWGLFRLSEAGTLHGMTDLKMGGNLEMKPYVSGGLERDVVTSFATDKVGGAGLNAKVALTANLIVDATFYPDFAQVEADREQVNLTRFSLYFPEKREFFLEGAEVFSFGSSGRMGGGMGMGMEGGGGRGGSGINLFYSRRIGLVEGHEVPILGGIKVVGKIGQYQVGMLSMQTERAQFTYEDDDEAEDDTVRVNPTNYSVFRIRRDVLERASLGFMFLNKEEDHSIHYHRSLGFDGNFPLSDYLVLTGSFAGAFGPENIRNGKLIRLSEGLAGDLSLRYDNDLWQFSVSYQDVGAQFDPELGFMNRIDYRLSNISAEHSPRPQNSSSIRQLSYRLSGRYRTDHNNVMQESELSASFTMHFQNSARITIGAQREAEYLPEEWEVREGHLIPEGIYSGIGYYIFANSDQSRLMSGRCNINYGNYYSGSSLRVGCGGDFTAMSRIKVGLEYDLNHADLPSGSFHTNTVGLRTFYFLSTELFFKAYVQLNDDKLSYEGREKVVSNFLVRWIYSPGSDLYLVYNDGRMIGPGRDEISNRTFMLKATFFWRR